MNAVGIDVSKGKSMVAIMRPFGEIVSTPFEIKHTTSDINSLVELINSENNSFFFCIFIQIHWSIWSWSYKAHITS